MKFKTYGKSDFGNCEISDNKAAFCADKDCDSAYFSAVIQFENAEDDCYIFMPACAYNGNKLKRVERNYPPMYYSGETGENFEPLMTDVPALNKDGSGKIQVTSGDMATPCVGFFNRRQKKAVLVYTHQLVKDKNVGFCVQKNRIEIQFPSNQNHQFNWWFAHP